VIDFDNLMHGPHALKQARDGSVSRRNTDYHGGRFTVGTIENVLQLKEIA
jgi:hypothetical protein